MTPDEAPTRAELDAYRAETQAYRAESTAFRNEVLAEIRAMRAESESHFKRLETRLDALDDEVGRIARRLFNSDGDGDGESD